MGYVQTLQQKGQNNITDVVLVSFIVNFDHILHLLLLFLLLSWSVYLLAGKRLLNES